MRSSTLFTGGAAACLLAGLAISGWQVSAAISDAPVAGASSTETITRSHTRIVKKVVRGRVITLAGGQRVVMVPLVVIHNLHCHPTRHHRCVRRVVIPAHTIPLRAAVHRAVAVAAVAVPVTIVETITEPGSTVTLPADTVTDTTTVTDEVTVTVTVPLQPGGTL